jgi:hypothetical protein
MLRVEAVRQGRRRRSARRRRTRTRRVPRPSSGRRTSPRGFRHRRAACRAPQRARRRIQGRARREPTPRRGAPKHVATGRFKIPAHLSILSIGMSSLGPNLIEEAEATLEEASGASGPPRSPSPMGGLPSGMIQVRGISSRRSTRASHAVWLRGEQGRSPVPLEGPGFRHHWYSRRAQNFGTTPQERWLHPDPGSQATMSVWLSSQAALK